MLAVPAGQAASRSSSEIAANAISGFTEPGHFLAFVDGRGTVEAATEGFAELGISTSTLAELVSFCQQRLEVVGFPDYPGAMNGLQVSNSGTVRKIGAAVDAGLEPFRRAAAAGVDFLIVHHGLFWEQSRPWTGVVREKFDVASSHRRVTVGRPEIDEVVSKWTGVPLTSINEDEGDKLLRMEEELHARVISQDKAISAVSRAIRRSRAGLKAPTRPVGSFLFLGPTGVGKTELARALENLLFGSDHALIRFDMSEYMEKHSVSKLIG